MRQSNGNSRLVTRIHALAIILCLILFVNTSTDIIPVPAWRTHVIYVPQALPPMAGTPLDLVKECLQFQSRANTLGAQVILKGWYIAYYVLLDDVVPIRRMVVFVLCSELL